MIQTYGDRWVTLYKAEPNQAWVELLDRYTPQHIAGAIERLSTSESTRQHPPSLPAFEALLQASARAKRAEMGEAEWRRGYWRARIVHGVATGLGYSVAEFEPVLIAHKGTLGASMRLLLDELDDLEARTGQRTDGQENACTRSVRRITSEYNDLHALRSREPSQPVTHDLGPCPF